jgi:hypothetical protein
MVKTATDFTPFHLIHDIKELLPIECDFPTLCMKFKLLLSTIALE